MAEQEDIENQIKKLEDDRKKIKTTAYNWREKANDIFMFARYAKEDFDSDDWKRKRTVIKKLGADLKLSGRTIQFTPIKYLVPIEKQYPELKQQFELARTDSEQMKKRPPRRLNFTMVLEVGLDFFAKAKKSSIGRRFSKSKINSRFAFTSYDGRTYGSRPTFLESELK